MREDRLLFSFWQESKAPALQRYRCRTSRQPGAVHRVLGAAGGGHRPAQLSGREQSWWTFNHENCYYKHHRQPALEVPSILGREFPLSPLPKYNKERHHWSHPLLPTFSPAPVAPLQLGYRKSWPNLLPRCRIPQGGDYTTTKKSKIHHLDEAFCKVTEPSKAQRRWAVEFSISGISWGDNTAVNTYLEEPLDRLPVVLSKTAQEQEYVVHEQITRSGEEGGK